MDSKEILSNIQNGNLSRALQLVDKWIQEIPIGTDNQQENIEAKDLYLCLRFLIHRQDRIQNIDSSFNKAKLFLRFLSELTQARINNNFTHETIYWKAVKFYIHSHIADGFAKAFSGQRSYNLETDDIIQLSLSLIEIGKYPEARDSLMFLYQSNDKNATINLLLAFTSYYNQDMNGYYIYLREALFINPAVIENYLYLIPSGIVLELWNKINSTQLSKNNKFQYLALMLEINGIYKKKKKITETQYKKLIELFQQKYQEYQHADKKSQDDLQISVLQYLCWIIYYAHNFRKFEDLEMYRNIMIQIDEESYTTFYERNIKL